MSDLNNEVKENRKRFRVDHFDMTIIDYVQRNQRKELILNPPYQRLFRWNNETQSALIESILIGIPIPPIFVFQNEDAKWEIIDGLQRTKTLLNYLNKESEQKFSGCNILTGMNGKSFYELPENLQRIICNTRIRIELVEETDDIFSQYLLFNRLNSSGERLEAQEIRNFLIYKLNSDFYERIQNIANEEYFKQTIHLKSERISKQENVEYVLKFFLGRELSQCNQIEKYETIDELITKETEKFLVSHDRAFIEKEFEILEKTFKTIYKIFGENSFRYYHKKINNIANTFSSAIGISFIIDKIEDENKDKKIKDIAERYFSSEEYKKITDRGYSPTKRMHDLNKYSKNFFEGAIK